MLPPSAMHRLQVAREHGLLLLLGHRPLVEVGALVRLEAGAVRGLHQRHAELVQVVALARLRRRRRSSCRECPGRVCRVPQVLRSASRAEAPAFGPVQAHRVVDSSLLLQRCGRRRDVRDEVDQQPVVGHVVLQVGVRPVGAPEHAVGEGLDDAPGERHHVAVGSPLAGQRLRAGDRQPLGAAHLAPHVADARA